MIKSEKNTCPKKDGIALRFLYHSIPGRVLLKGLTAPKCSQWCGKYLDSQWSKWLIAPFIRKNHIDMSDYEAADYQCFNDCFCRRIKSEKRPVDTISEHLISPCDGLLSVYTISSGSVIPIKQSAYSIAKLVGDHELAQNFEGGLCLVFRLCVDHYHRYVFPDDGIVCCQKTIRGKLHTVRPIALAELPVFTENSRALTLVDTVHFGRMVQMEIGAMLVGRIVNETVLGPVRRGQEKGHFEYGGSTVILLFQKNKIEIDDAVLIESDQEREIPVKMGECIGFAKKA